MVMFMVTKPARPVRNSLRGVMKGRIRILGDIVSPIDVAWDAEKRSRRSNRDLDNCRRLDRRTSRAR